MASHFFFLRVSRVCSRSRVATDNPPSRLVPSRRRFLPELTLPRLSPSTFYRSSTCQPNASSALALASLFPKFSQTAEAVRPRERWRDLLDPFSGISDNEKLFRQKETHYSKINCHCRLYFERKSFQVSSNCSATSREGYWLVPVPIYTRNYLFLPLLHGASCVLPDTRLLQSINSDYR